MTPKDSIEDADPGLARERTELAWTRTAISFAALGGAILKNAPILGFPVLAFSVVIWALGRAPYPTGAGRSRARQLLVTASTTAAALAALVLTFTGPHP